MNVDFSSTSTAASDPVPSYEELARLAGAEPRIELHALHAGYGRMEILHGLDLAVGRGQSLCLIGPNGAGKSTVLHSIAGFTRVGSGAIRKDGADISRLAPDLKLKRARIAYVLQDNSVFPDMTVEENLWLGGYLLRDGRQARRAADDILEQYPRLARRRRQRAGSLSGGERRLLEITRALVMDPDVLLVDEPSIGLEPRFIDQVFALLAELQHQAGKTIILVEQNAKKGLEFADIGYVLVAGRLAMAAPAAELLQRPEVGRLFLGG